MRRIVRITVLSLLVSSFCHSVFASNKFEDVEGIRNYSGSSSNSSSQRNIENFIPTGSVISFAGTKAPQGWLLCDGRIVSRTKFRNLYDVIERNYTPLNHNPPLDEDLFCVPDMRGRTTVGVDDNAGRVTTNNSLGETGGQESTTLSTNNLPPHSFSININQCLASNTGSARRNVLTSYTQQEMSSWFTQNDGDMQSPSVFNTNQVGQGQSFTNMFPYISLNYIIKH
jgi:microcystin-dependent protein